MKTAEEVHVELFFCLGVVGLFNRAGNSEPGIVDKNVDLSVTLKDLPKNRLDLRFVRHVTDKVVQIFTALSAAAGKGVDKIAFSGKQCGGGKADAAAAACDDCNFHI